MSLHDFCYIALNLNAIIFFIYYTSYDIATSNESVCLTGRHQYQYTTVSATNKNSNIIVDVVAK